MLNMYITMVHWSRLINEHWNNPPTKLQILFWCHQFSYRRATFNSRSFLGCLVLLSPWFPTVCDTSSVLPYFSWAWLYWRILVRYFVEHTLDSLQWMESYSWSPKRRFSFGTRNQAWSLKSFCVAVFYPSMKTDRGSFWHRHQKRGWRVPPSLGSARELYTFLSWLLQ